MKTIDDEILAAMLISLDGISDEELKEAICNTTGAIGYAVSGMDEEDSLKSRVVQELDDIYNPEVTIVS